MHYKWTDTEIGAMPNKKVAMYIRYSRILDPFRSPEGSSETTEKTAEEIAREQNLKSMDKIRQKWKDRGY